MKPVHNAVIWLSAAFVVVQQARGGGVTLDGTAGPARNLAGPAFVVSAADGRQAGTSLFHSFGQLSLSTGESLTFTGPASTTIIVARVTGGSRSQIDGAIDTATAMPAAHLYLVNPAGISFGPTASLNVGQSFTATSADNITLQDGTVINSRGPLPSALTVAPPSAFGFVSPHQGTIDVQGANMVVPTGRSLALVSGKVRVTQGAVLRATNGQVQIVAAGDAGTAYVDAVSGGAASLVAAPSPGELTVDAASRITADGAGAGRVDLLGQQINIAGTISARTQGGATGARINLFAIQDCTISGGQLSTRSSTPSPAGPVTIQAGGLLSITAGGLISANTTLYGNGGLITLAPHDLLIDGAGSAAPTGVTAQSQLAGAGGTGGNILIQTHDMTMRNSAAISTVTFGGGNAGNVQIQADTLNITSGGQVLAQARGSGAGGAIFVDVGTLNIAGIADVATGLLADTTHGSAGVGGQITVNCQSLKIGPLGVISTTTNGSGTGGGISVSATTAEMDGGHLAAFTGLGANAQSSDAGAGGGGNIALTASDIQIRNGAGIAANTFGPGKGGDITVTATQQLLLDGGSNNPMATGIFAKSLGTDTSGAGGNLLIRANSLRITRGGSITSATEGFGDGGDVNINGAVALVNSHGEISASATGTGTAGNLVLAFSQKIVGYDSTISVSASQASGGDLSLEAPDIVLSRANLTAQAHQNGGSIFLAAQDRIVLDYAVLNAKAGGNGGSIHLDPMYVVLHSSDLTADAINGNGGSILINTLWYLPSVDSRLTVSSVFGVAGNVAIETPNPLVSASVAPPRVQVPQPTGLLLDPCEVRFAGNATSLLVIPNYNPAALPPLWAPIDQFLAPKSVPEVPEK